MGRIVRGVDLDALDYDQYGGYTPGRVLILDGDGPAYVAAATVKTLPTAIRRFQTEMLKQLFFTKSERARVHLTASRSLKAGRFKINAWKPYQGNRKQKAKPALLEPLRMAMAEPRNWLPEFEVILHWRHEADDGMMVDSYEFKENGLIWSDDKDLRMTPYPYWEKAKGIALPSTGFGSTWAKYTEAGDVTPGGHGPKFFWLQMLMGDTADNIRGLDKFEGSNIGVSGALAVMETLKSETDCVNFVLEQYRKIDQNPLPEAWLLWLLRSETDNVWRYFEELNLNPQLRAYLAECVQRPWFNETQLENNDD